MITINAPFLIALTIIIYLIVIKCLEWYLFQNKSFHFGRKRNENSSKVSGTRLKALIFFDTSELKRPWYVAIPIFLFTFSSSMFLIHFSERFVLYQWILFYAIAILLMILFDMGIMLRVNRDYFLAEGRKKRYLRSQGVQFLLSALLVVTIMGAYYTYEEKQNADPIGLRDSVEWVIEPTFRAEWPRFTEGLAPVGEKGRQGFINKKGEIVIPLRYEKTENFHEELAAVMQNGKWGYINRNGFLVIPFQFDNASEFGDGLAPVQKDGVWMVINQNGEVVFKTEYDYIYPYNEGVAMVEVRTNTSSNLIDKGGNLLLEKEYEFSSGFHEGCISVSDQETRKTYYIDINETKVISLDFIDAGGFINGYAPVWLNEGTYALIDHAGNIIRNISEDEYYAYGSCSEGLVNYHKGEWGGSGKNTYREGFKDCYGNIIIPAEFQNATDASDGLIGLTVDGLWGFVENPLPEAARGINQELWQKDRTQIGTVEGLPVYAGELERYAYSIKEANTGFTGITVYKKAFEKLKVEKAFEKYAIDMEPEKIQYQIGNTYYKKLLI